MREIGLRVRRPYVDLPLTQARRLRRMAWLTAHAPRLFPMRQWRRVLFTDESRFTLYRADGVDVVCTDVAENALQTPVLSNGIGLGVARVCQDFLANNNIAPLAWPPYSPDLTPNRAHVG